MGDHVGLGPVDMEFVDLIARTSPVTPGELATRSGLSPATVHALAAGLIDVLSNALIDSFRGAGFPPYPSLGAALFLRP